MFPNGMGNPVDCGCPPQGHPGPGGKNDDWLLPALLGLAVLFGGFYFVIKAGVKAGLLELMNDPKFPFRMMGQCCD